ncbi:MAG: FG-GAP repeat protein, partial [Altibacter sp.]|nr:FG-GAP repeat protein [Altibacter sp.]
MILIFFSITVVAQWENVGQVIYGESGEITGGSVSFNETGERLVLFDGNVNGDPGGMARVFELQNGTWIQLGQGVVGFSGDLQSAGPVKMNATGDRFIFSSPSNDSNGVQESGIVRVFELVGGSWVQLGQDLNGEIEGDYFGYAVDISDDGETIAIGSPQNILNGPGYVKIFNYINGVWSQIGSSLLGLNPEDQFGQSISLSANGDKIAIAAPQNDSTGNDSGLLRIFELLNNEWEQLGGDIFGTIEEDNLGGSISPGTTPLSLRGNSVAVGARGGINNPGYVKVYRYQNNSWELLGQPIVGLENSYGASLCFNEAGNILVISDPFESLGTGIVQVFRLINTTWQQFGESIEGDGQSDVFGLSIDLNSLGNRILIGAPFNDGNGANSGKVVVLQNDDILQASDYISNGTALYPNPNRNSFSI